MPRIIDTAVTALPELKIMQFSSREAAAIAVLTVYGGASLAQDSYTQIRKIVEIQKTRRAARNHAQQTPTP